MVVKVEGSVTLFSPSQSMNAPLSILVTPSGIVTPVRLERPLKTL